MSIKKWYNNLTIEEKICTFLSLTVIILLIYFNIKNHFNSASASNLNEYQEIELSSVDFPVSREVCEMVGKYYIEKEKSEKYSDSILLNLLRYMDVYYPEIILAQAEYESGKGTSNIGRTHNNLFGMKKAMKRYNCRNYSSEQRGYSKYYNWQLSVIDRVLWDFYTFDKKPTKEEYYNKIKKVYCNENPNYIKTLKEIVKKYEN